MEENLKDDVKKEELLYKTSQKKKIKESQQENELDEMVEIAAELITKITKLRKKIWKSSYWIKFKTMASSEETSRSPGK